MMISIFSRLRWATKSGPVRHDILDKRLDDGVGDEREDVERKDIQHQVPHVHTFDFTPGGQSVHFALDVAYQHTDDRLYLLPHHVVTLGLRRDFIDDETRQVGVGGDKVEVARKTLLYPLQERQRGIAESRQHRFAHQAQLFIEDTLEDIFLRAEIVMQHGVRHPGRRRDRRGAGAVETFGQELLLGSRQNRLLLGFCRFCHGSVIY